MAEELQEVAFVAPTRGVYRESGMEVIVHLEDFLEGEHKGAPLIRGDSELLEDLHTEGSISIFCFQSDLLFMC